MQVYQYPERKDWPALLKRPVIDAGDLKASVTGLLLKVKEGGDAAVRELNARFDGISTPALQVEQHHIEAAGDQLPGPLKSAIRQAAANIRSFHAPQAAGEVAVETMPGVRCWRRSVGIESVGLYIPGGTAPLFSTVLMLGIPATIAGCREIILCTPPGKDGNIHPAILFAATVAGINKIYRAGGVQAIGAMAFGTATVPAVRKIFGPGNQYVTCAKQLVQQQGVAIDMPAGPSEVAVYADASAVPAYVAADLLSQAEHGPDSQVVLVLSDENLLAPVQAEITRQLSTLGRQAFASAALENSKIFIVKNTAEAMDLLNAYAPEHLILSCRDSDAAGAMVVNAGSVFLGNYSPESAGDYATGTNHTLPTNGYATTYSGVSVDSFVKKITYQQLTREGLQQIGPAVMEMAAAEGLGAHRNAVALRLSPQPVTAVIES
jgi:histidinol dehydrogenase